MHMFPSLPDTLKWPYPITGLTVTGDAVEEELLVMFDIGRAAFNRTIKRP